MVSSFPFFLSFKKDLNLLLYRKLLMKIVGRFMYNKIRDGEIRKHFREHDFAKIDENRDR